MKRDISKYMDYLTLKQEHLVNYLHALQYGQSEQQNRRAVAMEARTSLRSCSIGCISLCTFGKLSDPQLVSVLNKRYRPDKIAKQLGNRQMIEGITMVYSYRYLQKRNCIYMFRFGRSSINSSVVASPQTEISDTSDPTSVSLTRSENLSSLPSSIEFGAKLPGITREQIKKKLSYRFVQKAAGTFHVTGIYGGKTAIDSFSLRMVHLTDLLDLRTMLYTPDGANTTFFLPGLVNIVGSLQMRMVLM